MSDELTSITIKSNVKSGDYYRICLDGFVNSFHTLAEMRAWIDDMKRRRPEIIGRSASLSKVRNYTIVQTVSKVIEPLAA